MNDSLSNIEKKINHEIKELKDKSKDESLINRLRPQIESEGLIEPLTALDLGNSKFLLLAGQHRYQDSKA
jgi:ParB-like chromosome segregation protein Spo0J